MLHSSKQTQDAHVNLSISMVIYRSEITVVLHTLQHLERAVQQAIEQGILGAKPKLYLIDNEDDNFTVSFYERLKALWQSHALDITYLVGHGNIGFGRGHNLCLNLALGDFHLLLNPDITLPQEALVQLLSLMSAHPEIGLMSPCLINEAQQLQYGNRRYPSLWGLFLRGFAPQWLKRHFTQYLDGYLLKDVLNNNTLQYDFPIHSGCFLLLKREVWEHLEGFDPKFFLYFEDYDLSLRANQLAKTAYTPTVKVTHYGGNTAKKGSRHIRYFLCSAMIFFNKHGWKLW